MISPEIIDQAISGLGFQNASVLTQGGQKIVYSGSIAGAPAVAKIVNLGHGPVVPIALERANREVELLAAIDSPHFVKVLSDAIVVGTPPQAVAWVEELLDGQDFGEYFGNNHMDESEAIQFLFDVSRGLAACHELEVVHRDMSPGNVRRTAMGRYIIMDPGLARHLERTVITGLYQPGTPGFRSPEHLSGQRPQYSSDIFCLGLLAFWALTGEIPFYDTDQHQYDENLRRLPVSPIQDQVDLNEKLAKIINRCLHKQPARRYIDGNELLEDLIEEFGSRP